MTDLALALLAGRGRRHRGRQASGQAIGQQQPRRAAEAAADSFAARNILRKIFGTGAMPTLVVGMW